MSATPVRYTLVSHPLCPYVQRAAIALAEQGLAFERRDIDLAHKPEWFLHHSPLGKTPVLLVDEQHAIFESTVICEFLEDSHGPALHPTDALLRARHRAWMEFGSALLQQIAAYYNAPDTSALATHDQALRRRLQQLEAELGDGPFFSGTRFSLVDAVFGPVFRYFDAFEADAGVSFLHELPRLQRWRAALAARPSVQAAVAADYAARLRSFLLARGSALSRLIQTAA